MCHILQVIPVDIRSLLSELRDRWASADLSPSPVATDADISRFCSRNAVSLPDSAVAYCHILNGIPDTQLDGLARLWPLTEWQRLTERFQLHDQYAPTAREAWTQCVPIDDPSADPNLRLRLPPELHANGSQTAPSRWLLPDADEYFVFGDYNIEGSHWAVRLSVGNDTVLTVYDHCNSYLHVAPSFADFIQTYVNDCPDVMA